MSAPYKKRLTVQYTEIVFYNADGEEVGRERMHDDCVYDDGPREPLEDFELEDFFPELIGDDKGGDA